jgi:hypothetical protein
MESVLSLSRNVRKWLAAAEEPYPAAPRRSARRRKGSK